MGGTGNTGQNGELKGAAVGLAGGGGSSASPDWAAPVTVNSPVMETAAPPVLRPYETMTPSTGALAVQPATASGPGPVTEPTGSNLGFPTGFDHTDFPTHAAETPPVYAGPTMEPPLLTPVTPTDTAPKDSPFDWLYPGNLPMDFDPRQGEFGMPRPYSATGPFYTAGYGAAGNFGGVAGYGPPQKALQDQVLLPSMTAGTKLEGADIDQRNRVRREDYDRYMKLYGVGYDLPAYRNALNDLVYRQNMAGYGGTGGG